MLCFAKVNRYKGSLGWTFAIKSIFDASIYFSKSNSLFWIFNSAFGIELLVELVYMCSVCLWLRFFTTFQSFFILDGEIFEDGLVGGGLYVAADSKEVK